MSDFDFSGLKPCPFCGSTEHDAMEPYEHDNPEPFLPKVVPGYIACLNCDAGGPLADTVKQMKRLWNERGES